MSETTGTAETAVREPTAQQPEPTSPALREPAPAAESPRAPGANPGLALRAGAAVVAAALLGVGIGVGILKVRYDDPAPATAASAPASAAPPSASAGPSSGAKSDGTHVGSMRDLLLPMPAGYQLGPDAGAYGNDTELTDDQRRAWAEDMVRTMPEKLRDDVRKVWQDVPLKGAGVRSYATSPTGDLVVTVWLLQYHQDAVKADNAFVGAMASDPGLFREGPQIPGHQEAHCYLPAAPPGDKLDELICSAAVGDLRVEAQVEGVAPLPKDKVVTLLRRQLDRLALPGASA
ncbi:hypothetical protein [Saccharothrix sp. ST-888]|uniref:hypothetical protein n=1 Tax=Saccharothrix sp. ST-888 TaxID=1427391 RepID=UPI0005ED1347|nr:hypothetical protein [Saccharothrix sp. ST-888]KJK56349.1 hypothetical protein UK12_23215 [Saccharothrix sp. ST-888]